MCHRTQRALPAYLDYVATKPEHFSCLLWTFPLNLAAHLGESPCLRFGSGRYAACGF